MFAMAGLSGLFKTALLALALLPFVLADDLFAGCYNAIPGSVPPSTGPQIRSSSSACTAACYSTNTHSYFNASSGICWCSNGTPYQTNLQVGSKDNCGVNFDNRLTRTSYMSLEPQCYANRPAGLTTVNQYTGLNGCLNSCRNGLRATFWANTATGATNYYCACQFPTSYGAGAVCGPNSYFGYYHTPDAAASGLTKRQQREALLAKNDAKKEYCPKGWTACLIDESDDEPYECVDTAGDLESCGGCLNGQYHAPNATVGADCTSMTGAAFGGSTCLNGACQAFACKKGYSLVNGSCVLPLGRAH